MNKLKKITVGIIAMIMIIITMSTISTAYYVGQTVTLTKNDYFTNGNIFCMEHGQATKALMYYKVISNVLSLYLLKSKEFPCTALIFMFGSIFSFNFSKLLSISSKASTSKPFLA